MKIIDFMRMDEETHRICNMLVEWWCRGLQYDIDIKPRLADEGYFMPRDQWNAFSKVLDVQIDMAIGFRQGEAHDAGK